jgi:acyl carrier protein
MKEIGDIELFVVQAIAEVTQLPPESVWDKHGENVFREFGLDELLALDLVETLEHRYRIELPVDRIDELVSVDGAAALVREILSSAGAATAS